MRPIYHFTPPANWLNDPNGLVYYDGEYHLFYQHHPHSLHWGPMHWGHAVSRDLLHWLHLPIALAPDEDGMIFSGSAVVDWHNTAGFGERAFVAIYTCHKEPGHHETQCLASSLDQGRTWQKYAGNPVLPNPGLRDFRDPKVFWHANRWVMCLAAGQQVHFYTSPNLRDWTRSGAFTPNPALPSGVVWETPDLFELPVTGSQQMRWVLTLGVSTGAPAGGSGSCYFIGHFDGTTFTPDAPFVPSASSASPVASASSTLSASSLLNPLPNPLDYGPDFYAPQSWSDEPHQRRIVIGWMNNWKYAHATPAGAWRGMFSLPRELHLVETRHGIRLAQQPIAEVQALRREVFSSHRKMLEPGETPLSAVQAAVWDVEAEIAPGAAARFGFGIHASSGEEAHILFDLTQQTVTLNRSRSGRVDFHPDFAAPITAPLPPGKTLCLRLLVDTHTIELFLAGGVLTLTAAIFPAQSGKRLTVFSDGMIEIKQLHVFEMDPL